MNATQAFVEMTTTEPGPERVLMLARIIVQEDPELWEIVLRRESGINQHHENPDSPYRYRDEYQSLHHHYPFCDESSDRAAWFSSRADAEIDRRGAVDMPWPTSTARDDVIGRWQCQKK